MQRIIDLISNKYHPGTRVFTRVRAASLIQESGLSIDELDAKWDGIEEALEHANLRVLPPLPDADDGEDVRIFRLNAPLTRVIMEALFPTPQGDRLLIQTSQTLSRQPRQPSRHQRSQRNLNNQDPKPQRDYRQEETPDATRAASRAHYIRPLE